MRSPDGYSYGADHSRTLAFGGLCPSLPGHDTSHGPFASALANKHTLRS